ncbi:MAG: 4Fe-4S binding protein [Planctomycetes bacterium]|nr:4Fe-4S binding protein [Planctomycetota bacterium]
MIILRRISQFIFFSLFIYLIFRTVSPLASWIPVNLFFTSDPLVAIGAGIAGRALVIKFIAALVVIIITVLLGRVFCGWICPLGATIDWFDKVFLWWRKKRIVMWLGWRKVKYAILVILLTGAVFGVNAIGWLDPISIAFKGYGLFIYSALDWAGTKVGLDRTTVSSLIDIGIFDRNEVLFKYSAVFAITLAVILLLSMLERRFWCRNLCPLGALLGLLSKWRLVRTHTGEDCNECKLCVRTCKMGARSKELEALDEECIHCYTCVNGCPKDQLFIKKAAKVKTVSILPSRRGFLISGMLGILSFPLLKYSLLKKKEENPVLPILRPPGANPDEEKFLVKCVRCGECMKVCPYNAIQPLMFEGGIYGMFSPVIIPIIGYCGYECNLCGQACPTGAIKNMPLAEKKKWKIGTAKTYEDICINCLVCEEYCPVPDKAIKNIEKDGLQYPWVIDEMCIGCGTCENVCPASPQKAIRVFRDANPPSNPAK